MNRFLCLSLAALTPALLPTLTDAASLRTSVAVGASNDPGTLLTFQTGENTYSLDQSNTGAAVATSGSASFTGLDSGDESATMSFSGSAEASANYGQLRLSASGSVSNVIHNPGNAPYDDPESGFNPEGVPTFLASYAQSQFEDVLTYATGFNQVYKTNFLFHVTGQFTGTNSYHSVLVEFGTQSDNIIYYSPENGLGGNINSVWASEKFDILPGQPMTLITTTLSQFNVETPFAANGGNYSGLADFSNTVTLTGINLYDADDNLVSNWSLSADSGTIYPVPEPMVPAFLGLVGLWAVCGRRR